MALARTTSHRPAFTLLELVVVLAILAIALAAVAPALSGFGSGRKPDEAAAQFVALTRYARSQAITDGATYRLSLDVQAGRWWLMTEEGENFVDVPGPFGRVYTAPEGVRIECDAPVIDGAQSILFDPSGRSDTALIRFIGPRSIVEVACNAPIEEFHVTTAAEGPR